MKTPKLLVPALRQYCHNNGDEGFVTAYDYETVNELLADKDREIEKLNIQLNGMKTFSENYDADVIEKMLNSIINIYPFTEVVQEYANNLRGKS